MREGNLSTKKGTFKIAALSRKKAALNFIISKGNHPDGSHNADEGASCSPVSLLSFSECWLCSDLVSLTGNYSCRSGVVTVLRGLTSNYRQSGGIKTSMMVQLELEFTSHINPSF